MESLDSISSQVNANDNSISHYVFISFDLADSTKIKHQLIKRWPQVFKVFFASFDAFNDDIQDELSSEIEHWKVQGDEVIFRYELATVDDIPVLIQWAEKLLVFVSSQVKAETLDLIEDYHGHATPHTIPGVKTTMWMASVCTGAEVLEGCINQTIYVPYLGGSGYYEYIGPNIDLGFRIAKHSQRDAITLDMTLTWALLNLSKRFHEERNFDSYEKLFIHSFMRLKGIWDDNEYPIILYIPRNLSNHSPYGIEKENLQKIEKIFDVAKKLEIKKNLDDHIENLIALSSQNNKTHIKKRLDVNNPEVHCVAICFSKNLKSIYMRKRGSGRSLYPSRYDCGCTRLILNQSIEESIRHGYTKDYGIEVSVLGGNTAVPVATYEIDRNTANVNGFIFTAIVNDDSAIVEGFEKIKCKTLPDESDCVPHLIPNIKLALKVQKRLKKAK